MKLPTSPKHPGVGRDTPLPRLQPDLKLDTAADAEAANIQDQVQQLHDEQQSASEQPLIQGDTAETPNIEQDYKDAVEAAVLEKEAQAENLENRLEALIDKQETVLQQLMNRQPGILSLPGQKAKWKSQVQQQQALVSRMHNRLDTVKEIHDGMGLHSPRIHELATAKVRHDKPELAEGWDDMREAQRTHENLKRLREKERKEKIRKEQAPTLNNNQSKGNSLSLSRSPD